VLLLDERNLLNNHEYSVFLEDELIKITQESIKIDKDIDRIRKTPDFSEYDDVNMIAINDLYAKEYVRSEF